MCSQPAITEAALNGAADAIHRASHGPDDEETRRKKARTLIFSEDVPGTFKVLPEHRTGSIGGLDQLHPRTLMGGM